MFKTIISWLLAIVAAYIFIKIIFVAIGAAFKLSMILIMLVPLAIVAIPLYIIIRKKIFK